MVILSTPFDALCKELLAKPKGHPITDVLNKGREYEAIQASQASLKTLGAAATTNIDAVYKGRPCSNCGLHHARSKCPASEAVCGGCGNIGHWKKMCRKTKGGTQPPPEDRQTRQKPTHNQSICKPWWHNRKKKGPQTGNQMGNKTKAQHEVEIYEEEGEQYMKTFASLTISDISLAEVKEIKEEAFTTLIVKHGSPPTDGALRIKVDTGAAGNTLPVRIFNQMFPNNHALMPEPSTHLKSYSGHRIVCLGSVMLQIRRKSQHAYHTQKFYVINVPGPAIVGLPTCQLLGLVQLNVDSLVNQASAQPKLANLQLKQPAHPTLPQTTKISSINDLKKCFPDCFDGIGSFKGEEQLHLQKDAEAFIDPPRSVPIHLKDPIEAELRKMQDLGIIRRIPNDAHTDWCSSLTYAMKTDGSLRVCLDPQKLNRALKRCAHKIPTIEEITPAFARARFFTKLDAKAGYWSVKLAPESQILTTFRSPLGKFCFQRLPFGLSVSQDLFQKHMDQIIARCEGVVGISDDLVVFGETEEQHDRRLLHFFRIAREEGLMLNSKKCVIKTNQITFFGRLYTDRGVFPDPKKVDDVVQMPVPNNKQDLQRFLGMATYLAGHVPNFSSHTKTLRDLMKEDTPFIWSGDQQHCFDDIKTRIASSIGLQYYDAKLDVTLEVDASMKGLGAALLQKNGPVALASQTLTSAEVNYSNLARECLAIVHGTLRFHYFLYGRHFTVITDHKPLVMIFQKPIHAAPPALQRMLLKIQGYDFNLVYRPGPEMVLSDTLSRLPNQANNHAIDLDDIGINQVELDLLNFSNEKQKQIREETNKDEVLRVLGQVIYSGWPDTIQELPTDLREFWAYRDELAIESGIIFKGRQVLMPKKLRPDLLTQLHSGHQGIEKTRRLARESMYWPRINRDIEQLCKNCNLCQEMQPQQPREPMKMHEKPGMPWVKLGTDLFEIDGRSFLIIADYFSRYPFVKELQATTAATVIASTKEAFAMLGVPREVVSDNGPQYLSKYDEFCNEWGIQHTTCSPKHPQSNGFIERQIRYIKPIIKKCLKSNGDTNLALLNIRATPLDATLPSPAELMFGRPIPTALPSHTSQIAPEHYREHLKKLSDNQKTQADQHTRPLPPLLVGSPVRVLNKENKTWFPGKIIAQHQDRSYQVLTEGGRCLVRNRHQLRERTLQPSTQEPGQEPPPPPADQPNNNVPPIANSTPAATTETPATPTGPPTTPVPYKTRSGRTVQKPARLQD